MHTSSKPVLPQGPGGRPQHTVVPLPICAGLCHLATLSNLVQDLCNLQGLWTGLDWKRVIIVSNIIIIRGHDRCVGLE
jgi:hypothetical protein